MGLVRMCRRCGGSSTLRFNPCRRVSIAATAISRKLILSCVMSAAQAVDGSNSASFAAVVNIQT